MSNQRLKDEIKQFNPRRSLLAAVLCLLGAWIVTFFIPAGTSIGIISVIPALFLIVYIFITKRILEALTLASCVGFMITSKVAMEDGSFVANFSTPKNVLDSFSSTLTDTMMNEDIAWLFIVCGLMGSIISLIERAGGAFAFGEWVSRKAKTEKSTLLWSWLLGIVIFIDDYLNSLTVGSCMAPATDKHKTPREMLAYVVDSTAAPVCVLIPITTWAVFCGKLLEENGWAPEGKGLYYFIQTIPFSFYAILATICVPLVIIGIIPKFGPMRGAYKRVAEGGPLAPAGSEKIDIKGGIVIEKPENPKIYNFLIPIVVLVGSTIFFDLDMQYGVIVTLVFMFVFYLIQKIMTADDFWDVLLTGIKNMILPLLMMVLAFLFSAMNEEIGFTAFCIKSATNLMTPALMPFIIFIILAITEFITGTNWGMYIIALPIVIPLAEGLGVNMPLAVSAVISAGVLGSHVCFYSDATILTSAATGCNNFRHALTQAPFGLACGGVTAILYLIVGIILAP